MQIQVSGHQFEVSPALREYAIEKIERIARHFERLIDVHVILRTDNKVHEAEANIQAAGRVFNAVGTAEDMYAAIDALSDKLDAQVRKYKEKLTDHHRSENVKRAVS